MSLDYTEYWSDLTASHARHPGNRFRYDLIADEVNRLSFRPRRLVDCGCGDGSLLETLIKRVPCEEAYGMDVAANAPARRPGRAYHFTQQDLGKPIPESMHGQYDLVVCSEVIEHVPDDESVLRNLAALASPQGTVILTTQSGRIYKTEKYLGHLRHYQLGDLAARVRRHGLHIRRAYRCGWPWLNLQKIAAHLFQGTVQNRIVHASELSLNVRLLFSALRQIYRFSARSLGPQIVIVAEKR